MVELKCKTEGCEYVAVADTEDEARHILLHHDADEHGGDHQH
jgi:hypothetical protein